LAVTPTIVILFSFQHFNRMQQLHVRNLFKLIIPVQLQECPNVTLTKTDKIFGFTLTFPTSSEMLLYQIKLLYGTNKRMKAEEDGSQQVTFSSRNPILFQKFEEDGRFQTIILQMKIAPGFDFRKVPKKIYQIRSDLFQVWRFATKRNIRNM